MASPYSTPPRLSLTPEKYSDRFTPIRESANWEVKFNQIESNAIDTASSSKCTPNKKGKESNDNGRDGVAYECLLKNELLGAGIEDVKEQERKPFTPLDTQNLFTVSNLKL